MLVQAWNYIVENKQWLFDGLGIALFGAFVAIIRWYLNRREKALRIEEARKHAALVGTSPASRPVPLGATQIISRDLTRPSNLDLLRYCSICNKSERNVSKMIITANANICAECIEEQQRRLDYEPRRAQMVQDLCELTLQAASAESHSTANDQTNNKIHELATKLRNRKSYTAGDIICNARLVRVIGAGSFATVWEANPIGPSASRRKASEAVKVFRQDMLTIGVMLWRFQRGVRAMRKLADMGAATPSSIVRFHGTSDDLLSFSMEYVAGGDIHKIHERQLTMKARLQVFLDVAEGVAFAHDCKIIHRDIKPANILLRPDGRAAITDFDIADLAFAATQSVSSGALGTAQFAAPEQQNSDSGTDAHPTADIFSLGKLLYFLVTEKSPPSGTTSRGDKLAFLKDVPHAGQRAAIEQALRAQPEERPQSVSEFLSIARL